MRLCEIKSVALPFTQPTLSGSLHSIQSVLYIVWSMHFYDFSNHLPFKKKCLNVSKIIFYSHKSNCNQQNISSRANVFKLHFCPFTFCYWWIVSCCPLLVIRLMCTTYSHRMRIDIFQLYAEEMKSYMSRTCIWDWVNYGIFS